MTSEETKKAVEGYFAAWTSNKPNEARTFLADDLEFIGPSAHYRSADEFYPALVGFSAMTRGARMRELLVDGERAALLYDCDLPPPVGTLRIASFFRVVSGKIKIYDTQFDATEFRKLIAQKGG